MPTAKKKPGGKKKGKEWVLRLYIAGKTPGVRRAIINLERICDEHLKGTCHLEVIDVKEYPEMAVEKNITAIPTLIKELPLPIRTVIGDLSESEKVLVGLDIKQK